MIAQKPCCSPLRRFDRGRSNGGGAEEFSRNPGQTFAAEVWRSMRSRDRSVKQVVLALYFSRSHLRQCCKPYNSWDLNGCLYYVKDISESPPCQNKLWLVTADTCCDSLYVRSALELLWYSRGISLSQTSWISVNSQRQRQCHDRRTLQTLQC